MPLGKVSEILKEADQNGFGVIAFNTFNYESIAWAIETAEEEKTPVIVAFYPGMSSLIPGSTFAQITKDLAAKVKIQVGLHLDHSSSYEQVLAAVRDGFTSVMIDGSSFEFETNIQMTKEVVKASHAMGVDVEAELGHVGYASNPEDFTNKNHFTDPSLAVEFIERTGVDSLAIAIGSAHGNYVSVPKLDFELLTKINKVTEIPLVLHGGTGIPDEQLRKAVKLGINKLNVGTGYFQTFYQKTKEIIDGKKSKEDAIDFLPVLKGEVKEFLRERLRSVK